ncbi:hypothetical protein [Vibrio sp. Sgm 5]|uniref:hypothetical protein n=1 Tax=Vibrio sp. Sgm 5 TaxID=2994387 RepID=UPI002248851D|nr:hypothetical protein [Vibrio sp. Sgm 5]MCX2791104.1 hypothetical protein [Vibrio sp. Sgm 5]
MNNFKKAALTSLVLAGMAIGSAQAADPTAVVVWTGKVPAINAGDTLVITGLGGDLNPVTGTLAPNVDGTFVSPTLLLESHTNDGTAEAPVVGALKAATWTVKAADIAYAGSPQLDQVALVKINGEEVAVNGSLSETTDSIGITISQTAELAADVSGKDVQASVTLLATSI